MNSKVSKCVVISLALIIACSGIFVNAFTPESIKLLKEVRKVKLVVKVSSWTTDSFDIENALRQKFESVGIIVVSEMNMDYDATVFADYEETKCGKYSLGGFGSCIDCAIRIVYKNDEVVFKTLIHGRTDAIVKGWSSLLGNARDNFIKDIDKQFSYIVFLRSDDCQVRRNAVEAIGKRVDCRDIGPLKFLNRNEPDNLVRKAIQEVLNEIQEKERKGLLWCGLSGK